MYLQRWHGWCHNNLLPESQSQRVLCTPYNHAPCHFMQSHICKVYACLAVTCHLRLWQNDRGLLRATAVTRGWNGYRNKSQHRKLTLEKKILPPLQQGFEPATFRSQVRCSNHCAIPAQLHTQTQTAGCRNDTCLVAHVRWGDGWGEGQWYKSLWVSQGPFKIQDYFIILSEKFNMWWNIYTILILD